MVSHIQHAGPSVSSVVSSHHTYSGGLLSVTRVKGDRRKGNGESTGSKYTQAPNCNCIIGNIRKVNNQGGSATDFQETPSRHQQGTGKDQRNRIALTRWHSSERMGYKGSSNKPKETCRQRVSILIECVCSFTDANLDREIGSMHLSAKEKDDTLKKLRLEIERLQEEREDMLNGAGSVRYSHYYWKRAESTEFE